MATIDHGYSSARIRAMKSRLLDREFFERLVGIKSLTELVVALEQTDYKKDLHEAVLQAPGAESLESGLRKNIVNTFDGLRRIVDGRVRPLVDILLGRWDVQNIKTILRGLHHGVNTDEIIGSLVPAGSIDEATLEALAAQSDVRACLNLMATWSIPHSKPLTEVLLRYQSEMRLQVLEFALDKFYFEESLKQLKRGLDAGLVREVIMREIDVTNIMTLLRLGREETSAKIKMEFFLPGGKQLSANRYEELAELQDIHDIIEGLSGTVFAKPLKHGWEGFLTTGRFSLIERALEARLIAGNVALFRAQPLSIAVLIAYVWAKLNEVVNLRIIVRGHVAGMPDDKIRQALVFV
jgi:V/A-type H+/Na+-transporting ATPase subunit C